MLLRCLFSFTALIIAALPVGAQQAAPTEIPMLWDVRERLPKPDLAGVERLRFLTTTDFAPFNFVDASGRLSGFHIDLARAICEKLDITPRCQIQALPWDELDAALASGEGEALLSGLSITAETRANHLFSRPYLQFPARFAALKGSEAIDLSVGLAGKRIAVVEGSAHQRMAETYFPDAQLSNFTTVEAALKAVADKQADLAFGDGLAISRWLAGANGSACCIFVGGPYLAPDYLGHGLAIALPSDRDDLRRAMDFALHAINADGTFAELYLRYFPVGFF